MFFYTEFSVHWKGNIWFKKQLRTCWMRTLSSSLSNFPALFLQLLEEDSLRCCFIFVLLSDCTSVFLSCNQVFIHHLRSSILIAFELMFFKQIILPDRRLWSPWKLLSLHCRRCWCLFRDPYTRADTRVHRILLRWWGNHRNGSQRSSLGVHKRNGLDPS